MSEAKQQEETASDPSVRVEGVVIQNAGRHVRGFMMFGGECLGCIDGKCSVRPFGFTDVIHGIQQDTLDFV